MEGAHDLLELADIVARSVRALSGFERVMVYRFGFDGDGEVAGESLAEDWNQPFLGLRFPASDIPPQARALYRVSHQRWIPARDYDPIPLVPNRNQSGEPFDLSFSHYRSISPIHQAYQQNIGADGAMSLSVLCDGALWGLVIGHHRRPHRVSAAEPPPYLHHRSCFQYHARRALQSPGKKQRPHRITVALNNLVEVRYRRRLLKRLDRR